ncbi:MAG: carbon starvation protein A [Bacillota bacterium]
MNSVVLLFLGVILFIVAYTLYGGYLARQWGIDPQRKTPSEELYDGYDYVPTNAKVLFGHHFSSIAGAGPITGPILAIMFGWLPVYLWIVLGSAFVGGVHDFAALFASIRHKGKSIGEVIETNVGKTGKTLFCIFAWLALILVIAAFTSIAADAFANSPSAGTASMLFILIAILFGRLVYRQNVNLAVSTVAGVILIIISIWIGYSYPFLKFSVVAWQYILLIYVLIASVLPVWLLLQPRDYLSSFLLIAMIVGGVLGVLIMHPNIQTQAVKGFTIITKAGPQYLFPILFVTVACGAISGFHSLVSSGTTAKQIANERDARFIGYGGMLTEGTLAILALISVAYVATAQGSPAVVFASGISDFMASFGVPREVGKVFVILAFTGFVLTSLDTAARLGRYVFEELFTVKTGGQNWLSNRYVATLITVVASYVLLAYGYQKIWPIFGASNQLLGALALLAVTVWLARSGKKTWMTFLPMVFMFCVTLTATFLLILNFFKAANYTLFVISLALFILAVILVVLTYNTFKNEKMGKSAADSKL